MSYVFYTYLGCAICIFVLLLLYSHEAWKVKRLIAERNEWERLATAAGYISADRWCEIAMLKQNRITTLEKEDELRATNMKMSKAFAESRREEFVKMAEIATGEKEPRVTFTEFREWLEECAKHKKLVPKTP